MPTCNKDRNGYKKISFDKLTFSKNTLTFEEALKNKTPISWTDDVISGKKQVIITK